MVLFISPYLLLNLTEIGDEPISKSVELIEHRIQKTFKGRVRKIYK